MNSIVQAVKTAINKGHGDSWSHYCCPSFQIDQHCVLNPEFRDFNMMLECEYWGARSVIASDLNSLWLLRKQGE